MPLFSEHISNMYYSGSPSYSNPYSSYSSSLSPLGTSYSASYLNPGGTYSGHSSLSSYSRAPLTSRWVPGLSRNYSPMLTPISERGTSSPVRINSPRRISISKRNYGTSAYTQRPININTSDIDVSRDKYRRKSIEAPVQPPKPPEKKEPSSDDKQKNPFMPRVDGKPETGIDSSPGTQRNTIKRGRTVVRLHTIKRKERDSPRKPIETVEPQNDVLQKSAKNAENEIQSNEPKSWRDKFTEDLNYTEKREQKSLGTKFVEAYIVKDLSLQENDLKTEDISHKLPVTLPLNSEPPTINKSQDRRCSMELLAEQASVLDSLIRSENLSTATLDLSKVGVAEIEEPKSSIKTLESKKKKITNRENPLKTTKSDQSLHENLKSLRNSKDSNSFSKRRSLKKSASGGSMCRLDSITETPKDPIQNELPAIEENRTSVNLDNKEEKQKPKLKTRITAYSVEISPPTSPLKFKIENVTVEEKVNLPKKEIIFSSTVEDTPTEDVTLKSSLRRTKERHSIKKKNKKVNAPISPEPEDGNFWDKIGKRETVYLMKRKQNLEEAREKHKRALFWFPESEDAEFIDVAEQIADIPKEKDTISASSPSLPESIEPQLQTDTSSQINTEKINNENVICLEILSSGITEAIPTKSDTETIINICEKPLSVLLENSKLTEPNVYKASTNLSEEKPEKDLQASEPFKKGSLKLTPDLKDSQNETKSELNSSEVKVSIFEDVKVTNNALNETLLLEPTLDTLPLESGTIFETVSAAVEEETKQTSLGETILTLSKDIKSTFTDSQNNSPTEHNVSDPVEDTTKLFEGLIENNIKNKNLQNTSLKFENNTKKVSNIQKGNKTTEKPVLEQKLPSLPIIETKSIKSNDATENKTKIEIDEKLEDKKEFERNNENDILQNIFVNNQEVKPSQIKIEATNKSLPEKNLPSLPSVKSSINESNDQGENKTLTKFSESDQSKDIKASEEIHKSTQKTKVDSNSIKVENYTSVENTENKTDVFISCIKPKEMPDHKTTPLNIKQDDKKVSVLNTKTNSAKNKTSSNVPKKTKSNKASDVKTEVISLLPKVKDVKTVQKCPIHSVENKTDNSSNITAKTNDHPTTSLPQNKVPAKINKSPPKPENEIAKTDLGQISSVDNLNDAILPKDVCSTTVPQKPDEIESENIPKAAPETKSIEVENEVETENKADKEGTSVPTPESITNEIKQLSIKGPAKLTPSPHKNVKEERALKPLIATPRPLQKRAPQIIHSSESSDSSSDDDSSDEEEESDSSEGSTEFFECENNGDGRTSTGSNDSGFDSSAPNSPATFNQIRKDCDVNCHRKCEKLTANLCGVNQRLLVEALATRTASKKGTDSPGTSSSNSASKLPATDILEQELEQSTAYGIFRKTGRFTPPARSIPRFRKYMIEDFQFIKVLGKGSFGKVLLAELRDTEYYYAVKCLKKDVVLEDDDVECTLIERKVLALGTNHPYLCHLFATFQTDSHLFFVMEYLNGGDLMFHIQQSGRFPEARARFYAAEIVSGLKFLHKRGIVYRDLKLDNILLDFDGHVRIADFGMCKLQIYLEKTADTFCGTPDYMAPEIIKGLKYNQTVDWWSFGVLLYEMLIGQSPFSGCDEDELFWSICNEMPSYPRFLSQEALTILTRLLDKDARTRLGGAECMHGDIREQDFFHQVHWDRLERRELEAPFRPRVRHPLDTQYFDRAFTGERPRLTAVEPHVLRSMDQEPFRGFSYTNPNATDR